VPEITPKQKAELDKNIRLMLSQGASNEDVVKYSNDYRDFLKKKESSDIGSQVGGIVGTSGRPLVYANEGEKPILGLTLPKQKSGNELEGIGVIEDKTPLPKMDGGVVGEVVVDKIDPVKSYRNQLNSQVDKSLEKLLQRERQPKVSTTAVAPKAPIVAEKVKEEKKQFVEEQKEKKEKKLLAPAEIDKKVAEAKRLYSEDQNASVAHLMESSGLSANEIFNLPKERLQELVRPGNETDELAVKSISESQDVKNALSNATSLPEAAIYFAAKQDPQLQEQISRNLIPGTNRVNIEGILSQGSIGSRVADFLFNPIVEKEIKKNPGYQKEFEATVPLLINKYPDFGKAYLGNKISQKMEDMGINNAVLNVVTEAETDKAVEELQKENKITPNEVQFYKDNLRGEGGYKDFFRNIVGKGSYKTSGAIENILGGAVRGTLGIGKGASEALGLRQRLLGKTEVTARDFSDRDLAVNIAPKGIAHEISMSGGETIGQLAPFFLGGAEALAAKTALAPEAASGLLFGLQTYGNNIAEARRLFPGNELKQRGFATASSLIDAVLLNKLGSSDIAKRLSGEMRPALQEIVDSYASKNISKQTAEEGLKDAFLGAVKKVPQAAELFARQTGKNTAIMTAMDLAHQVNEGVFEGKKVKDYINGERVFDAVKSGAISSVGLSLLGTAAGMGSKGVTSKLHYQQAENPAAWEAEIRKVGEANGESQAEIEDKVDNVKYAGKVFQDLQGKTDMSEKQKMKFFINSLIQKAKLKEAESITDPVLKKRATAEAKNLQAEQEALLDNKDDGSIEGDVSDVIEGENLIEKKRAEEAPLPEVKEEVKVEGEVMPEEIKGEDVAKEAVEMGSDQGGISDYTANKIAKENYITQKIKIDDLRKLDSDLDEYLKSGEIREFEGEPNKMNPIVSSEGEVVDGYNRIAQALADGKTEIEILRGIKPKTEAELPSEQKPITEEEIKTEGWKPVEMEGEEAPFGETAPKEEKKEKAEKDIRKRALNVEASTPRGEVLQYFISGGKINPKALEEFFGKERRLGTGKIRVEERKSRTALLDNKAPSIEALAEKIAGTDRLDRVDEYRDAIEGVLLDHSGTKTMAEEVVNSFDYEYKNMLREEERTAIAEEAHKELQDIASRIPEPIRKEIIDLLDNFRDNDGFVDWNKLEEASNGFDANILNLSPESSKFIDNAINQVKQTGRFSGIPGEALPEAAKAGDALRSFANKVRDGKISKLGGFRAGTGFDQVWDASLEIIAKAIDGGASIADAIEAGLKYAKSTGWYKKLQNQADFDKKYREHLNTEYNAVQKFGAGEVLQRPQEGAGEAGSKRGGMEQGVKGTEVTEEGKVEGKEGKEVIPPVPPTEKAVEPTEEPEDWSSIKKAKLLEIDSVREMFEKKTKKAWSQTYQSGLENVQKMFPDKSLYEAMQSRVAEIQKRMENGELYNPTSEDLAVFNVLNAETTKRIKAVKGLDSTDPIERELAIGELENLENQQKAIAQVVNPTEAGRAFSIRQAEMMLDENNGLKIRKAQLQKAKGGEPLTEEEEAFVNENWEKEKALLLEEQKVKEEQLKAEYNAQIEELQRKYQESISKAGKTPEAKNKVAKTLSQTGKAVADQIRKLKINKKGTANLDFTLGSWDLAIEGIAQLVEKGATIAEAIDKLIKENKIGFKNKDDRDKFEALFVDKLTQKDRGEQVNAIKEFAEQNGINDVTNEMVSKNLIKDYFNSLIGEYPKEEIFDAAYKELKEILPNLTEENLREAFLKTGDFKQPTKKQLQGSIAEQERELKKIAKKELTASQRDKIRLQEEKDKLTRRKEEYKRKLDNQEFEETEPKPRVKKYDAELIRIKKAEAQVNQEFRNKEKQFKEKNKGLIEKTADFVKDAIVAVLIGGPKTLVKVGAMSVVRPLSETVRKATLGKLFDHLFPGISKAAKRGGESSDFSTISKGFEAYFRQMNDKQLDKKYEVANQEYEKARLEYENYKDSGSPDEAKLEKLKKNYQEKLVKAQSYFIYKFIGGSSLKDALQSLVNRSNEIEKQFGKVGKESIKEEGLLRKASYILGFLGRSHSAFKTFSGRYSFASSFMARLQGAVEAGEDITSPDKILEIAHESYLDWERGKYQQSNAISDAWASWINRRAEKQEDKGREAAAKAFRYMLSSDVAVTRVPVNILHEGLVEYTFGAVKAVRDILKVNKQMRQELKDAGITNGEKVLDELTEGKSGEDFKESLREKISQMDAKQAATIVRCFTKGGIGLGLYALALISGGIKFGIFPYKGQKKKKEEWELAPNELNPGQVVIGDKKLSENASGIIEHIPALFPMFMGLGMAQRYKDNIEEGKTTPEAAAESLYKHLEILQSDVPQIAFFDPLNRLKTTGKLVEKRLSEYGLFPEKEQLPQVKDPESKLKREMTKDEGEAYKAALPENFKEIIEEYRDSDKTVYFDVNGNIVLSKRDYPQKDRSSLESKDYSELSDAEIKKLYKKLKTVAKTKTLKELELEEVEEK
jgi:hypothetical protein